MAAMPDPSRSINSWRNDKDKISDVKFLLPGLTCQCLYSRTRRMVDHLEPEFGQHSIFTGHWDDIRSNCCCDQIEIWQEIFSGLIAPLAKRLDQFKSNAAAAKFVVWVSAIGPFRIKNCNSIGKITSGTVMIANNKIDVFFFGVSHVADRFDSTIERNDQRKSIVVGKVDSL